MSQPQLHDKRHRGWFWIENSVLDLHGPTLGATGIAIYTLLARHADSDGKAFPSLHRFQILLGLSRNTVKKYLKLLASPEVSLIRIVERTTLNGDADTHIFELLTVKCRSTIDLPGSTIDLPGSTIDRGVGQPLTEGRSTIDPEGNYLKETHFKEEDKDPPIVPPGDTHASRNETASPSPRKNTRRREHAPFPDTPETQEVLRGSILDAAFTAWYANTGVATTLLTPDLATQWEAFALDAQAHGRVYASWRQAFMKWLTSHYQKRRPATGILQNDDLLEWAKIQDEKRNGGLL